MSVKDDLFYRSSRLNTWMWKVFPMIFTILLGIPGVVGLLFPSHLKDTNTGEPIPALVALILIFISSLFFLIFMKFKNRYIYI